jgi:hypothetical protein
MQVTSDLRVCRGRDCAVGTNLQVRAHALKCETY